MAYFHFSVDYSIGSGPNALPGNIHFCGISLNAANMGGPKPSAKKCLEAFRKSPIVEQLI